MAVGEAGITMDDAACRKTNRATTGESTAGTTTRIADRGFGLISAAEGTSRDTLRQIRLLRPSTTARRLTQFRMGCVSRTPDLVRPDCWRTGCYDLNSVLVAKSKSVHTNENSRTRIM